LAHKVIPVSDSRSVPTLRAISWCGRGLALDIACYNTYIHCMTSSKLREEIRQTRPFSSLEQEAYLGMGRTWAALEHEAAEALKPCGITPTQYNVLRILIGAGEKGLCRSEIMERMISRVPDGTRLLDRMEAAGLIARARDGEDRRFVTTRITEHGRRLARDAEEPVMAQHRRQFGALSEDDLLLLIRILDMVRGGAS
jgi:DNA-binding MarR family transcriptional regulator